MGTTNIQLIEIMDNFGVTSFKGVFSKDKLNKLEPNSSYILNLEDQYDKDGNINAGSHWTCLVTDFNNRAIYFDSFGYDLPICVRSLLRQNHYEFAHTTKQVQNKMSDLCGYFCCGFIYFLKKHRKRTKNIYHDATIFLSLFEDLRKVKSIKNEYILSLFFTGKNKRIIENNNNIFQNVLQKDFKIENVDLHV
jgi:hypothetical protein